MANSFKSSVWALVLALTSAGCSLLLDPENCTSDADCLSGGVCMDGVCVGGQPPAGGVDASSEAPLWLLSCAHADMRRQMPYLGVRRQELVQESFDFFAVPRT